MPSFKISVLSWVLLSYFVIDSCVSCRWGALQSQRIQGSGWGAVCVCKLQAGRIKEPFPIGQLIGPHDVEEGRAECLQFLTRVYNLRQEAKSAIPLITITLNTEEKTWTQRKKSWFLPQSQNQQDCQCPPGFSWRSHLSLIRWRTADEAQQSCS